MSSILWTWMRSPSLPSRMSRTTSSSAESSDPAFPFALLRFAAAGSFARTWASRDRSRDSDPMRVKGRVPFQSRVDMGL